MAQAHFLDVGITIADRPKPITRLQSLEAGQDIIIEANLLSGRIKHIETSL